MSTFHTLKIKQVIKETLNAVTLVFDVPLNLKNKFQFIAGQYITIKKQLAGQELRRAYSICSTPQSGDLKITIKAVDNGTFSEYATTILRVGDELEVSKPEGRFILNISKEAENNYLGIAAGSGITPIMAMLKAVLSEEPQSNFTLIYGNKTVEEAIFINEIDALIQTHPNQFKVQYIFSRTNVEGSLFGRIDAGIINFIIKNSHFDKAYLCGPEELVNVSKTTLTNAGIDESSIYSELFTTPVIETEKNSSDFEGFSDLTILLDGDENTFSIDSKLTILTAALKEGIDVPYSCQGGICSSCLAKVTVGEARMIKNNILSNEEVKNGFILTCQAHSITQKITIDYDDV